MSELRVFVPERLGRRMSLGPFRQPQQILQFSLLATVAGLLGIVISPWACLPLLASAALLTLVVYEEEPLLQHVLRALIFYLRPPRTRPPQTPSPVRAGTQGASAERSREDLLWQADPIPLTGRSPKELLREG